MFKRGKITDPHTCFKITVAKRNHVRSEGTQPSIFYTGFSSPIQQWMIRKYETSVHMEKIHSPEVIKSNFDQWEKIHTFNSFLQAQVSEIQGHSHCSFFILVKVNSIKSKWVCTEIDVPIPSSKAPLRWLHLWRLLSMRCHINYLLEEQIPMVNSKQCVFLKQKARLKL